LINPFAVNLPQGAQAPGTRDSIPMDSRGRRHSVCGILPTCERWAKLFNQLSPGRAAQVPISAAPAYRVDGITGRLQKKTAS